MSKVIKIRRGKNINLQGKAEKIMIKAKVSETYAVKPIDFVGIMPKLLVEKGDIVKAGSPLFFDKYQPEVKFTSPVSGVITSINRGERRRILEIIIKADKNQEFIKFEKANPKTLDKEQIIKNIQESGLWPAIKQRPYSVIANAKDTPKAIFISAFDSAPLAPDIDFIVKGEKKNFQTGIDALAKLTNGKIHLNINADYPAADTFTKVKDVQINKFTGPHPSGNVGIQINKICPINKGEIIWVINPQDVISIGRLFIEGKYNASKIIALAGSEVKYPKYHKIINGACISNLLVDNLLSNNNRYISGNVLTGTKINKNGYLGYYDSLITVIPEGNHFDFLGWALPGFKKYSFTKMFFSWLMTDKEFKLDTNLKGGKRAFVMTGDYNKLLPMDIYPVQLIKAILAEDIDLMEKLGIYEIAEEDFALCEFACTSKTDLQSIIRKGLDLMRKEMS